MFSHSNLEWNCDSIIPIVLRWCALDYFRFRLFPGLFVCVFFVVLEIYRLMFQICFSNHFVLINFYFNLFWKLIHFVIILMIVFRTRNFEYSSVYVPISTSRVVHLVIWGQVFSYLLIDCRYLITWATYTYWQIMSEIFSFLNFFE